jgi:LytR cell envelope-related transcriptional attenuator
LAAVAVLALGACGGGDDDADTDATTTTIASTNTLSPATNPTTTTTLPPVATTLPPLELVTEGATVVVANASGINGSAGRMTDALAVVGFSTGDATNSSEGPLATSKIYYDPDNAQAKAVADSLREALGGGDIEVLELTVPAPLSDPESIGDASVLLAMGDDTADKSLDELQGRAPVADDSTDDATGDSTDDSGDDTADDSGDEAGGDDSGSDG